MTETTSILPFRQGDEIDDPLTALAREGARRILAEALAAEADAFVAAFAEARLEDGRRRVVRHGHGPERVIQTGVGPVPVRRPKVRDRGAGEAAEAGGERVAFTSAILPRWARRTRSLDALLPVLYLRGVSTGDFGEALAALLGRDAPNLSPSVIGRLKESRAGTSTSAGSAATSRPGATSTSGPTGCTSRPGWVRPMGRTRPSACSCSSAPHPRARRSSWASRWGCVRARETLARAAGGHQGPRARRRARDRRGRRRHGVLEGPRRGLPGRSSSTRARVHKAANVLNKVPRSVQPGMKAALREVRDAPDRARAAAAVAVFAEKYGAKYPKAVECLVKDQEALLAFFDFPAEHWDHLRTANPVESVFATVRHRTVRTKGALSQTTARLMVFKLVMAASKTWRRLKGENRLPMVLAGVTFTDGVATTAAPDHRAA